MASRSTAARVSAPEFLPNEPKCEGETALAGAIDRAVERFGPAADVVAGCGERLDKLCVWLRSSKPWIAFIGFLLLTRTVNAAPEDLPNLLQSLAEIVKAFQ